jgi:hypothetical protein
VDFQVPFKCFPFFPNKSKPFTFKKKNRSFFYFHDNAKRLKWLKSLWTCWTMDTKRVEFRCPRILWQVWTQFLLSSLQFSTGWSKKHAYI